MKKILILTRHAYPNYGSLLQAHSLIVFLRNHGFNAEILDYQNQSEKSWRQGFSSLKNSKMNRNILKKIIYICIQVPNFFIMDKYFSKFRHQLLNLTEEYNSIEELKNANLSADIFCTGSDQVWNTINRKLDPVYFWDFLNKDTCKVISYASSLGTSEVDIETKNLMKEYLRGFESITVREKSGKIILQEFGLNPKVVVDPVLLLSEEYWNNFSDETISEKNYILVYQLHDNKIFKTCLNQIKKENPKLKIIRLSPDLKSIKYGRETRLLLNPKLFLSYIKNSEFLVTDSFHGTVFSLIFRKKFVTILPPKNDARNRDLLNIFGLQNRIIDNPENTTIVNDSIDFIKTSEVLSNIRNESTEILLSLIQE